MCAGGMRGPADWGTLRNYSDLVLWATTEYAQINTADAWMRFREQLLLHMDQMFVYIGGAERVLLQRTITTDESTEPREVWIEVTGNERGLDAMMKPLTFRPWVKGDDGASKCLKHVQARVSACSLWWHWPLRCTRLATGFCPVEGRSDLDPLQTFNRWRGPQVSRDAAIKRGQAKHPVLDKVLDKVLLEVLCCGRQPLYEYCLNWFAWLVQKVGVKVNTYLVFWGTPGAGKGILFHFLRQLLGIEHCLMANSAELVLGHFNDHLQNKLFVFMDEIDFKGEESRVGTLRNMITEPMQLYTRKAKDTRVGPSYTAFGLATNNNPRTVLQPKERRAVVSKSVGRDGMNQWTQHEREEAWKLDPHHFARLLYERDISAFDPQRLPPNDNLAAMVDGKALPCLWFLDAIETGAVGLGEHVTVEQMNELYREWMAHSNAGVRLTASTKLVQVIESGWGFEFGSKRRMEDGVRDTYKVVPVYGVMGSLLPLTATEDELNSVRAAYVSRGGPRALQGLGSSDGVPVRDIES